jgi:cellulose synthase/poly-beta-1,6-N-acetylglucosamine synthase-like glycosyltransferase
MRTLLSATGILGVGLLLVFMLPIEMARWAGASGTVIAGRNGGPETPQSFVDTAFPAVGRRTIHVPAGGALQKALDEAKGGDLITLEPRAVYRGPFHLPSKDSAGWIVVSTAASTSSLPAEGRRIDPSHTASLPKLIASSGSVIVAGRGAHHFRFVGLEITPAEGVFLYELVELGRNETEPGALPHHIVFDRCYLHGDPKRGARRGIAMNSRETAVIDSYLSDFKETGADSQAVAGWNGTGPFKIANNYLEAAGENIMFGGADPTIRDLVPADIEIRQNHLAKPLRWKAGHEGFEGTNWSVKNLFELKNARRVLVEGNLLEYNWPQAQNGFAILFTVRNQDGRAPWSTVEDVVFANNVVRHVGAGINVLGRDDNHPSQRVRRVGIRNNLFVDVGGSWGSGRLFQLLDGTSDVVIEHNTALQTGDVLFGGDGAAHTGFVFENNIALHNLHGISGSGTRTGGPALARYFPASVVRRNVIVGGRASEYPADNFFPSALDEVGFASHRDGRFRLTVLSRYARAGTDGRDPGADLETPRSAAHGFPPPFESPDHAAARSRTAAVAALGPGRIGAWVFWLAFVLLGYVYLGYPLIAALRAAIQPRSHAKSSIEPMVSVIVAACNEGDCIATRIENLLALDYPQNRLEIIVGSDGSTDDTVVRARRYEDEQVKVRPFFDRRGKPALLNRLVPAACGEIVVFADARQRFERGALKALVASFADPNVGAVSGELILTADRDAATACHGACFYWRYEKYIRSMESRVDSTIGTTGAIYAIRRGLFEPIPDDTILDDLLIPLRIVRRGYRVLFEPEARAYDRTPATAGQEFSRKTRTIAGTFQLFARERWLFYPLRNRLWFQTFSHKGLRLILPALHLALFVANLAVVDLWPYRWILSAQLAFYAATLLGCTALLGRRRPLLVSVPYTMCLLCWATMVGFARTLTHRQPVTWERVSRTRVVSS